MDESMLRTLVESASLVGVLATWIYLERQSHRENIAYWRAKMAECSKDVREDINEVRDGLSSHIANHKDG